MATAFKSILLTSVCFIIISFKPQGLTIDQADKVKAGVTDLAMQIQHDISLNGPRAWLLYFYNSPGFFMASDGQLVFPDHHTAEDIIKNKLAKSIKSIKLTWNNLRIDPLTGRFAVIAAGFHEDMTDTKGTKTPIDGYFTATAQKTANGWQLRDAHWSVKHK